MKYIIQKIDKEKDLEERISDFTKVTSTLGEEKSGEEIKPKRIVNSEEVKILKPGDRILHKKKKSTGRNIYSDPTIWENN